jgi:hypothetical protein
VKTGAGGWSKGACKDWKKSGSDPMACTATVEAAKAVKHLKAAYLALHEKKPSPEGEPPKLEIRVGDPTVGGGLEAGIVKKRLLQRSGAFLYCYTKALEKNPYVAGKITLTFTVTPKGSVGNIKAETSTLADDQLVSCIEKKISTIKFEPPADGKPATVKVPVTLKTEAL